MNMDIKELAKKKKVKLWRIAEEFGMTDSYFSRKLRHELTNDEKTKIIAIIETLANEVQEKVL